MKILEQLKLTEAILNDSHRKDLFKSLFGLYQNAMPVLIKTPSGELICTYSKEVEDLADKIREEIRHRDKQIIEAYK